MNSRFRHHWDCPFGTCSDRLIGISLVVSNQHWKIPSYERSLVHLLLWSVDYPQHRLFLFSVLGLYINCGISGSVKSNLCSCHTNGRRLHPYRHQRKVAIFPSFHLRTLLLYRLSGSYPLMRRRSKQCNRSIDNGFQSGLAVGFQPCLRDNFGNSLGIITADSNDVPGLYHG